MTVEQLKKQFEEKLARLDELDYIRQDADTCKGVQDIKKDLQKNFYTVVVLGEFKRGKSTFINALLGKELLPTNVLPETATINAIMYSEKPVVKVLYQDGTEEEGELTAEYLNNFSAKQGQEKFANINYLKIGYPSDLLKNNIVLVDTPGVSDINESRCEVTYRFIPKANAVLFLLDANSPLKKTEKEFLEEKLLPMGLDKIIFVLNKYDGVDEDEEGDIVGNVQKRIVEAFKDSKIEGDWLKNIKVLPLSAKWALQGKLENNEKLLAASGLENLQTAITTMLTDGRVEQEKLKRYEKRLSEVLGSLYAKLENEKTLKAMSRGELNKLNEQLQDMLDKHNDAKGKIAEYVEQEKQNIKAICEKSLQYFGNQITEDTIEEIKIYHGADFKNFIEERVTLQLKRKFEGWVASYLPQVDKLLADMQKELSHGLSYNFQQKIVVTTQTDNGFSHEKCKFNFEADSTSGATTKAGLLSVGASGLATWAFGSGALAIGSVTFPIVPLVGMVVYPFLKDKLMNSKVEEAKAKVLPTISQAISESVDKLRREIFKNIDNGCNLIVQNTEHSYDEILSNLQYQIKSQLNKQDKDKNVLDEEISLLNHRMEAINEFIRA